MHPRSFFPPESGPDYVMPDLLTPLEKLREDFTVFFAFRSRHERRTRGDARVLTGVKPEDAGTMPEGSISMDMKTAEFVVAGTRFGSLTLTTGGRSLMSWTRTAGV